jgi:hypothetical protein
MLLGRCTSLLQVARQQSPEHDHCAQHAVCTCGVLASPLPAATCSGSYSRSRFIQNRHASIQLPVLQSSAAQPCSSVQQSGCTCRPAPLCLHCLQHQGGSDLARSWFCSSRAASGAADDVLCGRCHAAGWLHRPLETCITVSAARIPCHNSPTQPASQYSTHTPAVHHSCLHAPRTLYNPDTTLFLPPQLPLVTHIKLCALELPLVLACLGLQLAAALAPAATLTATTTDYLSYPLPTPPPASSSILLPAFWHHLLLSLLCHAVSGVLLPALIIRLSTTSLGARGSDSYSHGYSYSYSHLASSHAGTEAAGGTQTSVATGLVGGWGPQRSSYDSTKSSSSAAR